MDYYNLFKPLEMLYFTLKIASWGEPAHEFTIDQMGYYSATRASLIIQTSPHRSLTLVKLLRVISRLRISIIQVDL